MCSISGFLTFERLSRDKVDALISYLSGVLLRAEERGRDGFGITVLTRDGEFRTFKHIGRVSDVVHRVQDVLDVDAVAGIACCRAEPTTEYVMRKTIDDVQPMVGNYVAVVHNGIIANDIELERKYGLKRSSRIDTAVLPPLLELKWDGTGECLRDILVNEVVGGYALCVLDRRRVGTIWIATNFKPVYLAWDRDLRTLFFSTFDTYLEDLDKPIWLQRPVQRLEPYTLLEVSSSGTWSKYSLWRSDVVKTRRRPRALVISSGGLDSTVAATLLVRQGFDVTLLHFNYRHRAERMERRAVHEIARFLGVTVIELNTDVFKVIGRSPLLGEGEINRVDMGREGAEFAHEWVPARNLVFYSIAIAMAEAWGYDYVASGINLEESGSYPDNEMEFVRLLDRLAPYATGPQRRVRLLMPVGHLVKHEIVKLGLEVGAPLHLTWSCYDGGEKHCGRCGPCYMRRWAFKMNGVRDPVEYDLPEEIEREFWRGCRPYRVPRPVAVSHDVVVST